MSLSNKKAENMNKKNISSIKLILLFIYIFALALVRSISLTYLCAVILLIPTLMLIIKKGISLRGLLRALWKCRFVFLFIILGSIIILIEYGYKDAAMYCARLFLAITASILYVSSEDTIDIIRALKAVFFMKEEYALSMVIALTSIPQLSEDFDSLRHTARSRGISIRHGLRAKYLLTPLFMMHLRRVQSTSTILRLKGLDDSNESL